VPFLIAKSDRRATNPPSTPQNTISQKISSQNFEIAILFNVVGRSGNYIFELDNPPTVFRARVVSYALGHIRFLLKALS
jgi:hypothetical protein